MIKTSNISICQDTIIQGYVRSDKNFINKD